MKPSIVIRSPNLEFSNLDCIGERCIVAAERAHIAGYTAVALLVAPHESASEIQSILEHAQLQCDQLITAELVNQYSYTLTDYPFIDELIDLAHALKADICLGKFLGKLNVANLRNFVNLCYNKNVTVSLEPIPGSDIPNATRAASVIAAVGLPNLGITIDTCHAHATGNLANELFEAGPLYLRHVHLADSNREYIGSGVINFKNVISILRMLKYNGALTLEIYPKPNAESAFQLGTIGVFNHIK